MASYTLSPVWGAGAQLFDNSGNVLTGGKIYTYEAGTTTPAATYTTPTGSAFNSNPIIANASGRLVNEIWLPVSGAYKFVLKDTNDVLIATYDNIPTIPQPPIVNDASSISYEQGYTVTAGAFTVGATYLITSVGTTNFVAIGASANATGILFTATGVGSGTGTAKYSRTVQTKLQETVSVADFGAVGDGVTDDTLAIQSAADYAASSGYDLWGNPGTYLVTSTISLVCGGDLSQMTINADGTSVSPAVRFGTTSGVTSRKIITLPKVNNTTKPAGQWGSGIGIELANCDTCTITVPSVTNFEYGVTCGGYSTGFAYNTVNLMYIYSNKVNLELKPKDNAAWCNQNIFIGGRLGFNTSDFTTSGYVGTRDIVLSQYPGSGIGGPNNNLFLNTSIESTLVEYSVAFEQSASVNLFMMLRYEGTAAKRVLMNTDLASGINSNLFIGGYQANGIVFTYTGIGSSPYNCEINGRGNKIQSDAPCFDLNSTFSSGITGPHLQGFAAGKSSFLNVTDASTDWQYRLYAQGLAGKISTDTYPRMQFTWGNTQGPRIDMGDGSIAPISSIFANNSSIYVEATTSFSPYTNNITTLGSAGRRWTEVFATNGTINTSDAREKQQVRSLDDVEKAVALKIKKLLKAFKFNHAVEAKGDKARWHFGVIAQELGDAFKSEGLNPDDYGMFCYDEWEGQDAIFDENGVELNAAVKAGNAYGVRYEELLAFIIAAL